MKTVEDVAQAAMMTKNIDELIEVLKSYADEKLEEAAKIAEALNDPDEPMPTERRAFDMHVSAKAMAAVITERIRALKSTPAPGGAK